MRTALPAIVAALLIGASASSIGQDVWRTEDGKDIPETPARKARNGLGVWLLVTADADWSTKWATPSWVKPTLSEARRVVVGGKLTVLTLVVNPSPDARLELNVVSHIRITRPDGSSSVDAPGLPCLRGALAGPATNVRLCEAVVQFSADPGDPVGIWKVEVAVSDLNRRTTIPVEATFELAER